MKKKIGLSLSGSAAGAVNGFFGAGGGMVLVPLLQKTEAIQEEDLFPASLGIMIPICLTSLILSGRQPPFRQALPYLLGSCLGGILSGKVKISSRWLHRALGVLILLGGGRMLWSS